MVGRRCERFQHIADKRAQHIADASKEMQAVSEDFQRRMAFLSPPNFVMTQGHSLTVARGTWDLVRNILVSGEIPRVWNGLGIAIVSTSKGILTDKQAVAGKVGGEVLCHIW